MVSTHGGQDALAFIVSNGADMVGQIRPNIHGLFAWFGYVDCRNGVQPNPIQTKYRSIQTKFFSLSARRANQRSEMLTGCEPTEIMMLNRLQNKLARAGGGVELWVGWMGGRGLTPHSREAVPGGKSAGSGPVGPDTPS
jgi:hypothetical protein